MRGTPYPNGNAASYRWAKDWSRDGRDKVVIDDGGGGSSGTSLQTTGTSSTTSEKSKKSEAKKKEKKSGSSTATQQNPSAATGTKVAFDPRQNPEAALPPPVQTQTQQSVPATDAPREVQYLKKPTQSTSTATFSIPVTVAPQYPATDTPRSGSGRAFGDVAGTQTGFANPNFASRVKDTVVGGAKRSIASDLNSTANAYDLTRGARERMMNEYLADYEHGLEQAQYVLQLLEETGADPRDIWSQQNIVDDWQRKYDAMTEAIAAQSGATGAAYGLADDVKSSADAEIEDAKKGLNRFGRLVVDMGAKATQMEIDALKSQLLLNQFHLQPNPQPAIFDSEEEAVRRKLGDAIKRLPLAGRIYGENTQTARQEGADAKSAAVYGAVSAIVDTEIEKQFDGLSKFYGKAWADDAAKKFAKRFKNSGALQYIAQAGFNDFGEGVLESIATDLANEILKSTYNGKDSIQNGIETEWDRVAHNMLINTIIAILSGDSGMESN